MRQAEVARGRDMTVDIMKGLGILAVIVGHLVETGRGFIFSWHMPLFFIVAGYFYREREPRAEVRNDAARLLLPYALTCAALVAMAAAVSALKGRDYVTDSLLARGLCQWLHGAHVSFHGVGAKCGRGVVLVGPFLVQSVV